MLGKLEILERHHPGFARPEEVCWWENLVKVTYQGWGFFYCIDFQSRNSMRTPQVKLWEWKTSNWKEVDEFSHIPAVPTLLLNQGKKCAVEMWKSQGLHVSHKGVWAGVCVPVKVVSIELCQFEGFHSYNSTWGGSFQILDTEVL